MTTTMEKTNAKPKGKGSKPEKPKAIVRFDEERVRIAPTNYEFNPLEIRPIISEALDRAVAVMMANLGNPPKPDQLPDQLKYWEDSLVEENVHPRAIEKAARFIIRHDEFYPRLNRFMSVALRESQFMFREEQNDYYRALNEKAKALPTITPEQAQAIRDKMSPGARKIMEAIIENEDDNGKARTPKKPKTP